MSKKILITIVFLGNTLLFGQTGIVTGKIADDQNGEGISFSNIQLIRDDTVIAKTVADIDGCFNVKDIEPGKYEIQAASLGYVSNKGSEIIVKSGKTTYQDVEMESSAIMMCEIIICEFVEPLIDCEMCGGRCGFRCNLCCHSSCVFIEADSAEARVLPQQPAEVTCNIYPNPFMDHATVQIISDFEFNGGTFSLFDLSGKNIGKTDFSGSQLLIGREGLSAGAYLYRIEIEHEIFSSGKIVIQ